MTAYYNEIDPKAAAWLRELIRQGHIAPGEVDERNIIDVLPSDLAKYNQCHFFAGIGGWSYALRQAGWPDDHPVWTGSCPCQPFSTAGKGKGFADERHLWPAWFHLIETYRPDVLFGEQVEAAIRHSWLDLVQTDMEGINYTFVPVGLPAAGFGAPHIRQRLYFVADRNDSRRGKGRPGEAGDGRGQARLESSGLCAACELVNAHDAGSQGRRVSETDSRGNGASKQPVGTAGSADRMGNPDVWNTGQHTLLRAESQNSVETGRRSETNGFWRDADWLPCIDGKARSVEPGTFPLAHGAPARMVRLRGYGNAIVAQVAKEFIQAYMITTGIQQPHNLR